MNNTGRDIFVWHFRTAIGVPQLIAENVIAVSCKLRFDKNANIDKLYVYALKSSCRGLICTRQHLSHLYAPESVLPSDAALPEHQQMPWLLKMRRVFFQDRFTNLHFECLLDDQTALYNHAKFRTLVIMERPHASMVIWRQIPIFFVRQHFHVNCICHMSRNIIKLLLHNIGLSGVSSNGIVVIAFNSRQTFITVLTKYCWIMLYASTNWVIIGSDNGLSPFGAKPLREPTLAYFQFDSCEHISVKSEWKCYHFHSRKSNGKCRLPKWQPFCPGETSYFPMNVTPGGLGRTNLRTSTIWPSFTSWY